jgi:hypothetical protein
MSTSAERAARLRAKGTGDGELATPPAGPRASRLQRKQQRWQSRQQSRRRPLQRRQQGRRRSCGPKLLQRREKKRMQTRKMRRRREGIGGCGLRRETGGARSHHCGTGGAAAASVATNHRKAEWCTATPVAARLGRCWTRRTTTSRVRP